MAFGSAFRAGFVWDDDQHVMENVNLRTVEGLERIWLVPSSSPQYYPLAHTTWWLEYHAWTLWPVGYHSDNIFLHVANALLLWLLLRRLAVPGAWFAALLFAVHPLQVETVAWIMERKNLLSGFFYLLASLALVRFFSLDKPRPKVAPPKIYYALAILCFVLALLSKSVAATLPAAFLLVVWWKEGRMSRRHWLYMLPLFAMGIASGLLTAYLERTKVGAKGPEFAFSIPDRFLIAGRAACTYIAKLAWPHPQMLFYPRWNINGGQLWQYAFPAVIVIVVGFLWWKRNAIWRGPLAAALFFLGTLFPALGFFNVYPMRYSFIADHFQYMACIGPLALAAAALALLVQRRPSIRFPVMALQAATAGVLMLLTFSRGWAFQDAQSLYQDEVAKNPNFWAGHGLLGEDLSKQGRYPEAIEQLMQAVRLAPDELNMQESLANALISDKQYEQGLKMLAEILKKIPAGRGFITVWAAHALHLAAMTTQSVSFSRQSSRIQIFPLRTLI